MNNIPFDIEKIIYSYSNNFYKVVNHMNIVFYETRADTEIFMKYNEYFKSDICFIASVLDNILNENARLKLVYS